jgi:N-hydroxyarylamine O-acetyltransferase
VSQLLQDYLRRIEYAGDVGTSKSVLFALQKHHLAAIPFENLDVQLGVPVTIDSKAAFEKIVGNGRGGWCYEQNGLFGWALKEIGFDVTRVAAAVMRQERGDIAAGNHLCLLVRLPDLGDTFLADVGFGGGMLQPIPLLESQYEQPPFRIGLTEIDGGNWRFWEDDGNGKFSYDFRAERADESALKDKCQFMQNDPSSSFVLNLVAQIRADEEYRVLRGRVLKTSRRGGSETSILDSADELLDVLRRHFNLDVPAVTQLWPAIVARHKEIFPDP